jgi:hypothetical protein
MQGQLNVLQLSNDPLLPMFLFDSLQFAMPLNSVTNSPVLIV